MFGISPLAAQTPMGTSQTRTAPSAPKGTRVMTAVQTDWAQLDRHPIISVMATTSAAGVTFFLRAETLQPPFGRKMATFIPANKLRPDRALPRQARTALTMWF